MLRRKVTDRLLSWKNNSNKALLVTGARQIGKSYAIRTFGKDNYASYYEVDLLLDTEAKDVLAGAKNAIDFINRVALLADAPLVEGDTLIFVDEIQEYPQIVTLMKALVEDGRFSYVFSGSVEHIVMRPMDFEEFCWANSVSENVLAGIRSRLVERRPVENYIHEAMLKNFRAYIVCGGMPEVVQNYIDSGYSLVRTRELQIQLVDQYKSDISKYASTRAFNVRSIFEQIPVQLEAESHRFVVSSLGEGARLQKYERDFLWLVNAGVGLMVPQVTEARSPLKRTEKATAFKLYESDTGMLASRYPGSTARAVYLDMKTPNLGGLYENVVAQELVALGVDAWYYQTREVGEVDFVVEGTSGHVVPIEVKSGKKVRAHAALNRLMSVSEYKIPEAVVLSRENLSNEGKVLYVPIYMTFCLDEFMEKDDPDNDFSFAPISL